MLRKLMLILLCTMLVSSVGCVKTNPGGSGNDPDTSPKSVESAEPVESKEPEQSKAPEESKEPAESKEPVTGTKHTKVQIEMEDGGKMVLELYPEYAPQTVANFISLVESGFYDGLTFHRIIKGFMIQGGDPEGTGMGGSDKSIKGEFESNGFKQNTLKHTRGVLSMARSSNPNSASSQFFIMHADATHLDGNYAAFGKLIEGEETLDKIANTPVQPRSDSPAQVIKMKKVTVLKD